MKTQQRSFVVEYKSARRQLTKQPHSIWGDTNFKELVRQIEDEAPVLHEAGAAEDVLSPAVDTVLQIEAGDCSAVALPILAEAGQVATQLVRLEKKPVRRVRKIASHQTRVPADQPSVKTSEVRLEADVDELAMLESENLQLKAMLKKRLARQNVQLRGMLQRFDIA